MPDGKDKGRQWRPLFTFTLACVGLLRFFSRVFELLATLLYVLAQPGHRVAAGQQRGNQHTPDPSFFHLGSYRDSKKWAQFIVAPTTVDAGCMPLRRVGKL